ncbi:MAG: oligosaccharide flippase family protein [Alphaproteobacteria bacterium]|nr:oligosaccharide flippase family protein [Alphaproteobacteria bacterium]MBV9370407.1 oligosaccharide flippase family protein [Alphaproteobacteria bacterium]MBV9900326.1 oligosaccharide flippase family protein [Alphaproteobacteria bacterium]
MRGALSSGLGFLVRFGARFLFLLVAGRLYGGSLFGAYSLTAATVEAAVIGGGLSTKWMLFKWLDEENTKRPTLHTLLDAALLVLLASTAIAGFLVAGALAAPTALIGGGASGAAIAMLLMIPLQALIELLLAATRWTETMRHELVAKNLIQPYAGILVAVGAYACGWRGEGLFLSYIAGTLASLAYSFLALRRCFPPIGLSGYRIDRNGLGGKLRAVVPTLSVDASDALYSRLDIYVVAALLGQHSAGVYAMARQLSVPIRQIRQAFDGMLVPVVARTVAGRDHAGAAVPVAGAARLILLAQLPALILLAAIGLPLLRLVGSGFDAGFPALMLLAAAETIQGAFGTSELVLIYALPKMAAALTLSFTLLCIALALALERPFGLSGIALAVLLGYGGRAAARRILLGRRFSRQVGIGYWAGPALCGIGGLVAAFLAADAGRPRGTFGAALAAAAGLSAYAGLLWLWVRIGRPALVPQGFHPALGPERRSAR